MIRRASIIPGILIAVDRVLSRNSTSPAWNAIIQWNAETTRGHPWAEGREVIQTEAERGRPTQEATEAEAEAIAGASTQLSRAEEEVRPSEEVVRVKQEAMEEAESEEDEEDEEDDDDEATPPRLIGPMNRPPGWGRMITEDVRLRLEREKKLEEMREKERKEKREKRREEKRERKREEERERMRERRNGSPTAVTDRTQPQDACPPPRDVSPTPSIRRSQRIHQRRIPSDAPATSHLEARATSGSGHPAIASNTLVPSRGRSPTRSTRRTHPETGDQNVATPTSFSSSPCDLCVEKGRTCIPVKGMACEICRAKRKGCSHVGRKRGRSASRPPQSKKDNAPSTSEPRPQPQSVPIRSESPSEPLPKRPRRQSRPPASSQSTPVPSSSKSTVASDTLVGM